jgi:hypothetical protein
MTSPDELASESPVTIASVVDDTPAALPSPAADMVEPSAKMIWPPEPDLIRMSPFTSNFEAGVVVPIPRLPDCNTLIFSELFAWKIISAAVVEPKYTPPAPATIRAVLPDCVSRNAPVEETSLAKFAVPVKFALLDIVCPLTSPEVIVPEPNDSDVPVAVPIFGVLVHDVCVPSVVSILPLLLV